MQKKVLILLFSTLFFVGCKKEKAAIFDNENPFNPIQRLVADQVISIFENGTPVLQYGYIEYLNDGRGYTAGRAGFTSATCDLLSVLHRYEEKVPGNTLSFYLPRLQNLCDQEDGDISGLEGLPEKWKALDKDPVFRSAQDEEVDATYYLPAYNHCVTLGLKLPLSLLFLYDAIIQHGDGEDPDGLPSLIGRTTQAMNGTPASGIEEKKWILKFQEIRKTVLLNPYDSESKEVWAESVTRIDGLTNIYYLNNFYLSPPVLLSVDGDHYILPQ